MSPAPTATTFETNLRVVCPTIALKGAFNALPQPPLPSQPGLPTTGDLNEWLKWRCQFTGAFTFYSLSLQDRERLIRLEQERRQTPVFSTYSGATLWETIFHSLSDVLPLPKEIDAFLDEAEQQLRSPVGSPRSSGPPPPTRPPPSGAPALAADTAAALTTFGPAEALTLLANVALADARAKAAAGMDPTTPTLSHSTPQTQTPPPSPSSPADAHLASQEESVHHHQTSESTGTEEPLSDDTDQTYSGPKESSDSDAENGQAGDEVSRLLSVSTPAPPSLVQLEQDAQQDAQQDALPVSVPSMVVDPAREPVLVKSERPDTPAPLVDRYVPPPLRARPTELDIPKLTIKAVSTTCPICNCPGHFASSCPNKQAAGSWFKPDTTCYHCLAPGHLQATCPRISLPVAVARCRQESDRYGNAPPSPLWNSRSFNTFRPPSRRGPRASFPTSPWPLDTEDWDAAEWTPQDRPSFPEAPSPVNGSSAPAADA